MKLDLHCEENGRCFEQSRFLTNLFGFCQNKFASSFLSLIMWYPAPLVQVLYKILYKSFDTYSNVP